MDLSTLETEYMATLGSGPRVVAFKPLVDDSPAVLPAGQVVLTGWESTSSVSHVSLRSLYEAQLAPPSPTMRSTIGLDLNISAPRNDDALVKDVVASPVFASASSPELPSKKFALPADLGGGFTQWAPSM